MLYTKSENKKKSHGNVWPRTGMSSQHVWVLSLCPSLHNTRPDLSKAFLQETSLKTVKIILRGRLLLAKCCDMRQIHRWNENNVQSKLRRSQRVPKWWLHPARQCWRTNWQTDTFIFWKLSVVLVFGLDCIRTTAGEDTVSISVGPLGHFLVATCQLQGSYTPKQTLIYRLIYFNWTIIYQRTSHWLKKPWN